MVYIQPTLNYFVHGTPYIKGRCNRCVCATLLGEQCRRNTCTHRKCCWQHSKDSNALFKSFSQYQYVVNKANHAATDREKNRYKILLEYAKKKFNQVHYQAVVKKLQTAQAQLDELNARPNRGTRTLTSKIEVLKNIITAYRRANAQRALLRDLLDEVAEGADVDEAADGVLPESGLPVHVDEPHEEKIEGFAPPPLVLTAEDLADVRLAARLVAYWTSHCGIKNDAFYNDFADMTLDELKAIVVINGQCYLSYSATHTPDFITLWQTNLNERKPVVDIHRVVVTDAQLDEVMAAAHRVDVSLPRPEAPYIPDYPDGATFHSTPVDEFFHLELKDTGGHVRDLGYVPDATDPGNAYADGAVVVANIRRLWDNHRLINGEPPAGFLNGNIELRMHLNKSMEYWYVDDRSDYIDFRKLAAMATEASDLAAGLPP